MPDEVLSLIFEDLYTDSYIDTYSANPLRTAPLLVNKQISRLAQPIWFRSLIMSSTQLDLGLSVLNSNRMRQDSLRHLDVPLSNIYFNILNSVVSRLPNLASLTLRFANNLQTKAINTLADKVCSIGLRKLTLDSEWQKQPVEEFYGRCSRNKLNPDTRVTLQFEDALYYIVEGAAGSQRRKLLWSQEFAGPLLRFNWADLVSLELETTGGQLLYPEDILGSLEANLAQHRTIPLQELKLDVYLPSDADESDADCFQARHFKQLLQLLASTNLQCLALSDLDLIPDPPENFTMSNVKSLELSGNCNLKKSAQFLRLYNLLTVMPALTRLSLVGSSFFGPASIANQLGKVPKLELNFRYPELCTLLDFLRQSKVLIFTYRRGGEGRETRWTRLSKEEEFDRDCWTL